MRPPLLALALLLAGTAPAAAQDVAGAWTIEVPATFQGAPSVVAARIVFQSAGTFAARLENRPCEGGPGWFAFTAGAWWLDQDALCVSRGGDRPSCHPVRVVADSLTWGVFAFRRIAATP